MEEKKLVQKDPFQENLPCNDFSSASSMLDFGVEPYSKVTKEMERKNNHGKEVIQKEVISNEQDLDMLVRNATFVDERARQLLLAKKSFIKRFFSSQEEKIVEEWSVKMVSSAADFNTQLYKMATEARLTAMKEKYDAGLMLLKAEYRQRVGSFMYSKRDELRQNVHACQFRFLDDIVLKYQKAETVSRYPTLYERFVQSIKAEEEQYFNFLERIVSRFENIMDEQLNNYK